MELLDETIGHPFQRKVGNVAIGTAFIRIGKRLAQPVRNVVITIISEVPMGPIDEAFHAYSPRIQPCVISH